MKKGILIIGYPGIEHSQYYCNGVNIDLQEYHKFFYSSQGGGWDEDEMKILKTPSKRKLMDEIYRLDEMDYSIIVFSGHGSYSREMAATILELNESETCTEYELGGICNRLLILDCCRKPSKAAVIEAQKTLTDSWTLTVEERTQSRAFYEDMIQRCIGGAPLGVITTYACSIGEKARDDSRHGGLYSWCLLEAARGWQTTSHMMDFKSIVDVHNEAAVKVSDRNSYQHPSISKPRSGNYYPFVISYPFLD